MGLEGGLQPARDFSPASRRRVGFSPRGASAPLPNLGSARPWKFCGLDPESGFHRIPLDVVANLLRFLPSSNHSIEELRLPEGLTGPAQYRVCMARSRAFHLAKEFRERHGRRPKHMDVVGHRNPSVQLAEPAGSYLSQLVGDAAGDLGLTQVCRSGSGFVEEPIEGNESLAGTEMFTLKATPGGKTSAKPPRDEYRDPGSIAVWQSAAIGVHPLDEVLSRRLVSPGRVRAEVMRGLSPARAEAHPPKPHGAAGEFAVEAYLVEER